MAAYRFATFGAAPLCFFFFQKALDALLFNEFKVIYHAHVVRITVTLIKAL